MREKKREGDEGSERKGEREKWEGMKEGEEEIGSEGQEREGER